METRRIIIVGAGRAGRILAADIKKNYRKKEVVGFVDDVKRRNGRVLGRVDDLARLLSKEEIDEIIIAVPSAEGELVRRVLLSVLDNTVSVRIVPRDVRVLNTNRVMYREVKTIEVEDWLGRPIIKRDLGKIKAFYRNKRVLVTGGAGSIGSAIVRQLLELGAMKVIVLDHAESSCFELIEGLNRKKVDKSRYRVVVGSVLNKRKVAALMDKYKPQIVFHVAAYKHVGLMEANVDEAIRNNVLGTKIVLDASVERGANRFIFVSTDKVVNPTSVMGASKKIAEHYVQSISTAKTVVSVVRFGNVINSQGSVLPIFEEQIENYRYVTITDKRMKRFFMSIREAAELVIMSGTRSKQKAIYVLDMGDLISLSDVVMCLIRSKGLRPGVDVEEKIIGRRPGEKIEEELFTAAERKKMKRTNMANIFRLESPVELKEPIDGVISKLVGLCNTEASSRKIINYLGRLFPTLKEKKK